MHKNRQCSRAVETKPPAALPLDTRGRTEGACLSLPLPVQEIKEAQGGPNSAELATRIVGCGA